ncbi:FGGY-family carbohydrate kinase [Devosia nitrariae]|uniref:D-ribulokinase n=1 Tax=Devosia nitrariae TaxID=2071872 RepID=A0ABQ5WB82_9HYPH|nr:FGGY-family carbohydrate kinase [Devosia nitrariae]GLQ57041.1 D-ribulokinase [Devosia nitrariae]
MTETSQGRGAAAARYLIGVDVGTGSARAGVFTPDGKLLGADKRPISVFREGGSIAEQSSAEIWAAVAASVRGAVAVAGVDPGEIAGIGFDATCSLVVLGEGGEPLPVGDPQRPERDIILWMDHRAVEQAERINKIGHRVLDYVGGRISPEMETPKLLWLKENRPDVFRGAWQFFDLADFLTWRATGDLSRSNCTLTCKWTYLGHEQRWDASYFEAVGLNDLADEGFARVGTRIVDPGAPLGNGLTEAAAHDLGLLPATPVAAGLIDAHAGGIGSVGARDGGGPQANLAYVFGTSSCTMTTTNEPVFVPGVWGPYYSAMVPGAWLNEGGQSAAGAAIEQLLDFHPYSAEAHRRAEEVGLSLPDWLSRQALARVDDLGRVVELAGGVHIVPEFLGNRAPHADPNTRAAILGIGMERDLDSLVALYIAGLCGIGYGLRQIIEAQARAGCEIERIVISGGAGRSDLVRQLLADTTGVEVAAPETEEPVLLGSAILASVAAGLYSDIETAMGAMSAFSTRYRPASQSISAVHDERFAIFEALQALARKSAAGA